MGTEEKIQEAIDDLLGWCLICQQFTASKIKPDARERKCPKCHRNTVFGAEEALLMGEI